PTVSPTTAALCASEPFVRLSPLYSYPSSIIFLALSHAPPALDWKRAIRTPEAVTPASRPPSICAPPKMPNATGTMTASRPGATPGHAGIRVTKSHQDTRSRHAGQQAAQHFCTAQKAKCNGHNDRQQAGGYHLAERGRSRDFNAFFILRFSGSSFESCLILSRPVRKLFTFIASHGIQPGTQFGNILELSAHFLNQCHRRA